MSPYDLLARQLVNELDAVVLSVEWVFSPFHHRKVAKWYIWQLFYLLSSIFFFFSFWKYFPWLPPPSIPPSVLHNIVLSACLASLITGEVEVRMQQSEANRFSFGSGKDFPTSGIHALLLGTSGSACASQYSSVVLPKHFPNRRYPVCWCYLVATAMQQLWQKRMLSPHLGLFVWHVMQGRY